MSETRLETLNVNTTDFIQVVTMDRPDALNAFSPLMCHELCEVFLAAAADDAVRVLVLTGKGRAFTAGADLKAMGGPPNPDHHDFRALMKAIISFPKPFITAANGLGVGIGMTIHGMADMTFMAENARFKTPFSALGLTAEAASTYMFSRLMGPQKAAWVLMSGEWFTASQCVDMGLAMEVVADDGLMAHVMNRAATLAALSPASLRKTKELMMAPHIEALNTAVYNEAVGMNALAGGPANKEAINAFVEKRAPDFSNIS